MTDTHEIYASALKGYCPVKVCWQFLHDVANQLAIIHASNRFHGKIDLGHVLVNGTHFKLCNETRAGSRYEDIWYLAASTMELYLGSPILNGAGEKAQHKQTPIPVLPQDDTNSLNTLLHRCLSYDKGERPTAEFVRDTAKTEIEKFNKTSRKSQTMHPVSATEATEKIDKQWPESMLDSVKMALLVFLLLFMTAAPISAQSVLDSLAEAETLKLRNTVLLLRTHNKENWNRAQNELHKRIKIFTLMDELDDDLHDCLPTEIKSNFFGLNRMVQSLNNVGPVQASGKSLLAGSDLRYKYSLYEKVIRKGQTAVYDGLTKRSGRQVFMIIPYFANQKYSTELKIGNRKLYQPTETDKNGITYYVISKEDGPIEQDTLTLIISNNMKENVSFVIINHNYRDK